MSRSHFRLTHTWGGSGHGVDTRVLATYMGEWMELTALLWLLEGCGGVD